MKYYLALVILGTLVSLQSSDCKETELQEEDNAPANRILGGVPVGIEAAPFVAAVVLDDTFLACATVIARKFSLSTKIISKQLENMKNAPLTIRSHVNSWKDSSHEHPIVKYYIPDEDIHKAKGRPQYDWGLVLLEVDRQFHNGEKPAKLPPPDFWHPANMQVQVYGWGSYKPGIVGIADELRGVTLRLQPNSRCIKTDNQGAPTPEISLCTDANPRGPCQYDEGAPMISGFVVLGLSTYSDCTRSRSYYVRVSFFKRWIVKTMKNHSSSRNRRSWRMRGETHRRERPSFRNYYKRLLRMQYRD